MRFASVLLGVCTFALGLTCEAPAQSPVSLDTVLTSVREATGSPDRRLVVSRSRERIGGVAYEVTSESEGARYLIRRCDHDLCNGLFVDGERSYTVNLNDTILPLPIAIDPLQSSLRAVATGAFAEPAFARSGGRVERAADATNDERSTQRLVVATAHGAPLDVTIDAATHLVRSVATQDGKVVFTFARYRRVDGMTLPFEVDVDGKRNQLFDRRGSGKGSLEPPAGLVPRIAGSATLPLDRGIAPVVACRLGDLVTSCLIDSGNSGLAMSAGVAARLHLRPGGAHALRGLGSAASGVVRAPALHLGGATYPSARYVVLRRLQAAGADVALGADLFARTVVTIDYPARRLTLAAATTEATGLPITFENFLPIIGTGVGTEAFPVAIDTGDDGGIVLPRGLYDRHRALIARAAVRGREVAGVALRVRLGSYLVASAPATATAALGVASRARLGSAVLAHFRATFDYARERMILSPAPGTSDVRRAP